MHVKTPHGGIKKLHQYIEQEIASLSGQQDDQQVQLTRRLAELDQQLANLRDHLKALDPDTTRAMGLYDEAKAVADERQSVEQQLTDQTTALPKLPNTRELQARAAQAFDDLGRIMDNGTIEEKRELIGLYVQKIKADPDSQTVHISLYPPLFNRVIAGAGVGSNPQPLNSSWGFVWGAMGVR